ncbi:MAG: PAS domain-containing protein [Thermoleophilia bacterium]
MLALALRSGTPGRARGHRRLVHRGRGDRARAPLLGVARGLDLGRDALPAGDPGRPARRLLAVAAAVAERERAVVAHASAEAARQESERAARRAARVRRLAERVSVAATPPAVGEAFLAEALAQVDGLAGALMLVREEDGPLELSALQGDRAVGQRWLRSVPREERFLVGAAFASAGPVAVASRADLERRFPDSAASFGPNVRAAIGLRVVAFGAPIGAFAIAFDREGELPADDVTLLETMASVCGPALERARLFERERTARLEAERAQREAGRLARERAETLEELRERESRFRTLFTSIDEGYCLCEVVVDEGGRAVDYRFLEVNDRFAEQTGLVDAAGRTALELVPGLERHWIDTYARVGLGGETIRFENGSEQMGRWFDVYAAPVEPTGSGRFVLVFADATERHRAELELRRSEEAERRARRRAELLAQIHAELEQVDGAQERLERAVQLLVPRVADYATIEAPGREESLLAFAHADQELLQVRAELRTSHRLDEGDASSVARVASGERQLVPEVTPALRESLAPNTRTRRLLARLAVRSHAAVPSTSGWASAARSSSG